jgi:hypothetical protein
MLSKEFHAFPSMRCLQFAPKITLVAIKPAYTFADDTDVAVEGGCHLPLSGMNDGA